MTALALYYHPLSSYCWKVLVALYEQETPFTPLQIDADHADAAAALAALWPLGRFPVLRDEARGQTVPESSIIIEYLAHHYPGPFAPIPADPDAALAVRLWDRFFDNFVMTPMQAVVFDRIRPDGGNANDVVRAKAALATAYAHADSHMTGRTWVAGDFSLADCAAAPALHYADRIVPLREGYPALGAYLDRLEARPSFARVLEEAAPYAAMFPAG